MARWRVGARAFVQLPMIVDFEPEVVNFRHGFRDWALRVGDPNLDRVVIFTLDSSEVDPLRKLWSGWLHIEVLHEFPAVHMSGHGYRDTYRGLKGESRIASNTEFDARRWVPDGPLEVTKILECDLQSRLVELRDSVSHVTICADGRMTEQREVVEVVELVDCVLVATRNVPLSAIESLRRRLKESGLSPGGRLFGEAGSSMVFERRSFAPRTLQSLARNFKVEAGRRLQESQSWLMGPTSSVVEQMRRRHRRHATAGLGDDVPYRPVPKSAIEESVERVLGTQTEEWEVHVEESNALVVARECHFRTGVWPISFSYPLILQPQLAEEVLCPILPGYPYSFTDNASYMRLYGRSRLAITFRKAGWDCFRHVEILASGCTPLMVDAGEIPPYAMVHYPKEAMAAVARRVMLQGGAPNAATRRAFQEYFVENLTSKAMAQYMLAVTGHTSSAKILFIDEQTRDNPEYQSTLALIGLKQLVGPMCDVAFPADFIYQGSASSAESKYGRGFGYSSVLDPETRSSAEKNLRQGHGLDALDSYDLIVLGSISRNVTLSDEVMNRCDASKVIAIHGEDSPPHVDEIDQFRRLGAHVFVRAIHTFG